MIVASWDSNLGDRFQKLLTWTGFSIEETGTIYGAPGKPETQLGFKTPTNPSESGVQELETTPLLAQDIVSGPSLPDIPPELTISTQPDWGQTKLTKHERASLRPAL